MTKDTKKKKFPTNVISNLEKREGIKMNYKFKPSPCSPMNSKCENTNIFAFLSTIPHLNFINNSLNDTLAKKFGINPKVFELLIKNAAMGGLVMYIDVV